MSIHVTLHTRVSCTVDAKEVGQFLWNVVFIVTRCMQCTIFADSARLTWVVGHIILLSVAMYTLTRIGDQ